MQQKCANGEGSICERKNGHWEGHYTTGYDPAASEPTRNKAQPEAKNAQVGHRGSRKVGHEPRKSLHTGRVD